MTKEGITFYTTPKGYGKTYYELEKLRKENQQLLETSKAYKKLLKTTMQKEHQAIHVLDEIREYIENPRHEMSVKTYQNLLQILDKVKEQQKEPKI